MVITANEASVIVPNEFSRDEWKYGRPPKPTGVHWDGEWITADRTERPWEVTIDVALDQMFTSYGAWTTVFASADGSKRRNSRITALTRLHALPDEDLPLYLRIRFTSFRGDEGVKGPWSDTFVFPDDVVYNTETLTLTHEDGVLLAPEVLTTKRLFQVQSSTDQTFATAASVQPSRVSETFVLNRITPPGNRQNLHVRVRVQYRQGIAVYGPWSNVVTYNADTAATAPPSTPPKPTGPVFRQSASKCNVIIGPTQHTWFGHLQMADDTSGTNTVSTYTARGREHETELDVSTTRGKYFRFRLTTAASGSGTQGAWTDWVQQVGYRADFPVPDIVLDMDRAYRSNTNQRDVHSNVYLSAAFPRRTDLLLQIQSAEDASFATNAGFLSATHASVRAKFAQKHSHYASRHVRARWVTADNDPLTGNLSLSGANGDATRVGYGAWSETRKWEEFVNWIPQPSSLELNSDDSLVVDPTEHKWYATLQRSSDPTFATGVRDIHNNTYLEIHQFILNISHTTFRQPKSYLRVRFTEGGFGTGNAGPWSETVSWPQDRTDMPVPVVSVLGTQIRVSNPSEERPYRVVLQHTTGDSDFSGTVTSVIYHQEIYSQMAFEYMHTHVPADNKDVHWRARFVSSEAMTSGVTPGGSRIAYYGPWSDVETQSKTIPEPPSTITAVPTVERVIGDMIVFSGLAQKQNFLEIDAMSMTSTTSVASRNKALSKAWFFPEALLQLGEFRVRARYGKSETDADAGPWSDPFTVRLSDTAALPRMPAFRAAFQSVRRDDGRKEFLYYNRMDVFTKDLNDLYRWIHIQVARDDAFTELVTNQFRKFNSSPPGSNTFSETLPVSVLGNQFRGTLYVRGRQTLIGQELRILQKSWIEADDANRAYGPWSETIMITDALPTPVLRWDSRSRRLYVTDPAASRLENPVFLTLKAFHATDSSGVIPASRITFDSPATSFFLERSEIPWDWEGTSPSVSVYARFTTQVNDEGNPSPWSNAVSLPN